MSTTVTRTHTHTPIKSITIDGTLTINTWEAIAAGKRAAVDRLIPPEWKVPPDLLPNRERADVIGFPAESGLMSARELEITESDSVQGLMDRLARGEYTAVEVTVAFCKRAVIAHQLVSQSVPLEEAPVFWCPGWA